MATSLPCLVLNYGDKRPTKLYAASNGEHRPCEIGPLLTKRNWATAQGWVLAWDPDTCATFLWDPQDPEHGQVQLPPLAQAPPLGSECALSGDPTGLGGCTVVLAEPYESTAVWYCHAGGSTTAAEWVRHEYDLGGRWAVLGEYREWIKEHISGLVGSRGKFYYPVSDKDGCGVLEFSPEPVLSTVTTKGVKLTLPPNGQVCVHWKHFLFDLDDELHALCIFFAGVDTSKVTDIAVYKKDFAGSTCAKVDNIGDRAIVASSSNHAVGWCLASKFGLLPNSVYWMSPYDKCLHVYDIGTNIEELRVCDEDVAQLSRHPFWVIPVHHQ